MTIKTEYILKALHLLSWIIFVGLSIEACGFITNTIATLALGTEGASKFWKEIDLTAVYHFNESQYVTLASIIIIVTVLKALMFYVIVRIFQSKLDLSKPFNEAMRRFVLIISYMALGIGLFSFWGAKLAKQLVSQGVKLADIQHLKLGGADVWVFMGVTLLVIAFIFKRGVEIQNENDLTV